MFAKIEVAGKEICEKGEGGRNKGPMVYYYPFDVQRAPPADLLHGRNAEYINLTISVIQTVWLNPSAE